MVLLSFFFLFFSQFVFLKEENKAKEGIKFVTCFFLLRGQQFKKRKPLQIKTEQNETKQKEIKKEKGCGNWDIAAFGMSVFPF